MARGAKAASTLTPGIFDLRLDGIDAAFLYPSVALFAGAVEDHQLAAAMCRAYNRWLADYCRPYPPTCYSASPCCRCSRSTSPLMRCGTHDSDVSAIAENRQIALALR
jgi:hypothetical protein